VLWQTEDVTSMLPAIALTGRDNRKPQRLRLSVLDREVILDETRPSVAIGRADDKDIVIRGNLISRLHARIEFSRNRFTLTDQSTNGTFVQISGEEEAFVRRDTMPIKGQGLIGLGRIPDRDSPLTIHFVCEECT
jgi:adenylate cyclase